VLGLAVCVLSPHALNPCCSCVNSCIVFSTQCLLAALSAQFTCAPEHMCATALFMYEHCLSLPVCTRLWHKGINKMCLHPRLACNLTQALACRALVVQTRQLLRRCYTNSAQPISRAFASMALHSAGPLLRTARLARGGFLVTTTPTGTGLGGGRLLASIAASTNATSSAARSLAW
jgi:hypothetical protein